MQTPLCIFVKPTAFITTHSPDTILDARYNNNYFHIPQIPSTTKLDTWLQHCIAHSVYQTLSPLDRAVLILQAYDYTNIPSHLMAQWATPDAAYLRLYTTVMRLLTYRKKLVNPMRLDGWLQYLDHKDCSVPYGKNTYMTKTIGQLRVLYGNDVLEIWTEFLDSMTKMFLPTHSYIPVDYTFTVATTLEHKTQWCWRKHTLWSFQDNSWYMRHHSIDVYLDSSMPEGLTHYSEIKTQNEMADELRCFMLQDNADLSTLNQFMPLSILGPALCALGILYPYWRALVTDQLHTLTHRPVYHINTCLMTASALRIDADVIWATLLHKDDVIALPILG